MRASTRLALTTTAVLLAVTALPTAYVLSGPKWPTRTVNFYINPANLDVSQTAAETAVQAGAATWGSQSAADFRFYYAGRTNATAVSYNGKNEVFFRNAANGNTVAETYWWTDAGNRILDADIMFYDGGITFFTGSSGCSSGLYIEDVAAHEFGHALGLEHSSDPTATMYYVTSWCSTEGRSLANDDLAGVEALYPPSSTPKNVAPTVALTNPANGASYTAPATVALTATASDSDGSVARVDFLVNGSLFASDASAPYSASLTNLQAGSYVLTAVATDNAGAATTAAARTIVVTTAVVPGPRAVATYVATDTTTAGSWKRAYGTDGYAIVGAATSLPGYAAVNTDAAAWTWNGATSDPRAVETPAGNRIAACWYSASAFSIDVNLTDGLAHQVALYLLDWDRLGRSLKADVIDPASGAVLDTRLASAFQNGQYLVWSVTGHVVIRLTNTGPSTLNAVVSGIYFGGTGAGSPPPVTGGPSAAFTKSDDTTQGNWIGVYGSKGFGLAADVAALPSWAQATISGASTWTWASSTADIRGVRRPDGASRLAGCWFANDSFTLDVNVTDGGSHSVALYMVDWEAPWARSQRVDVIDAATGAVLDTRAVTGFRGGRYLVWTVSGHVTFRLVNTGNPNTVLSAVFVD